MPPPQRGAGSAAAAAGGLRPSCCSHWWVASWPGFWLCPGDGHFFQDHCHHLILHSIALQWLQRAERASIQQTNSRRAWGEGEGRSIPPPKISFLVCRRYQQTFPGIPSASFLKMSSPGDLTSSQAARSYQPTPPSKTLWFRNGLGISTQAFSIFNGINTH